MDRFYKKIPVEKIRPGMFVENVLNDKEIFLFSAHIYITGFHQIESLKRQGVFFAFIDPQKGDDIEGYGDERRNQESDPWKSLPEFGKIKQVNEVRNKTINTVRDLMIAARAGRFFSIRNITETVEMMIEQLLDNPDVFFGLCQIKSYSDRLYTHSVNVGVMMAGLASIMGYPREKIIEAGIGGILHDIGKVRIQEELVYKERNLTAQELDILRKHPLYGLEIIRHSKNEFPSSTLFVVSQHHERLNGGGYPMQLKGTHINEMALICAIADIYDQLTSDGFGRRACLPQEALALIFQGSDEEYPRKIVEYFTKLLGIYPVGSFVKLVSGEMGIVVKINRNNLLAPYVMILFGSDGKRVRSPYIRDLSDFSNERDREAWKVNGSLDPQSFNVKPADFLLGKF